GLFGHLDTVSPAAGQLAERKGDRVYGCGASDMKGALAVMLELLSGSHGADLVAVFYDREEGPYETNGLRELLPELPTLDLAVVLEPTANVIQAGCLGGLHALLTFRGQRAHSARPWQGKNAIYAAMGVLSRLAAAEPKAVRFHVPPSESLTFHEVMVATVAATANSRNVVPDSFVLNVNYRFAPGKSLEAARHELEDLVAGEAEIQIVDQAPSGQVSLDQPILAAWRARNSLRIEPKQAWTDIAQLTQAGIPAVNFGPGQPSQAHQADEWVDVQALVKNCELLADLLGEGPR
ncbi:MAG: succinyl-diaminopimelate desuccinylase, partial [Cyanobacteria bacterium REEB65]|nr:succinyl-diaminopimelate desuccinylase [Cyanobacteria bacterium REEB65]